jgi:hypothetical protein
MRIGPAGKIEATSVPNGKASCLGFDAQGDV